METGQSNVILDVEESRGQRKSLTIYTALMMLNDRFAAFNDDLLNISNPETNQSTRPNSLPIVGNDSTGEISLAISSSSQPNVFALVGKELKLISPLDRDHQDISSVILQVKILDRSGPMLFIRVTQLSIIIHEPVFFFIHPGIMHQFR